MKVVIGKVLRRTINPALGLMIVGGALVGCGEDKTNPEAVDLRELKFAFGLNILDQGNGTVRLTWSGMNNEDAFSGYNVYGAKDTDGSLSAMEGKSIQLLNDEGEQDAEGKAALEKMSYNGSDWETVGEAAADSEADFTIVPYHTGKDEDGTAFLPSCRPGAAGAACSPLDANSGDAEELELNGDTYLDLASLKLGSTYCFTVAATLDNGSKVSMTTSEVRCVSPRGEISLDATSTKGKYYRVDLDGLRTACGTDGGTSCGTLAVDSEAELTTGTGTSVDLEQAATWCNDTTTAPLCIEYSNGAIFTAGKNSGIADLGYYAGGFADGTFPGSSAIVWDDAAVLNQGGFSVAGQSLPLADNHIYVVAQGNEGGTATDKFYYHYIFVSNLTAGTDEDTYKITVRPGSALDDR